MELKEDTNLLGIYTVTDLNTGTSRLATRNLTPGSRVYGEEIQKIAGNEFRLWDPYRSKLAASILRDMPPACIPALGFSEQIPADECLAADNPWMPGVLSTGCPMFAASPLFQCSASDPRPL